MIVVMGAPGAGKTTVLSKAVQEVEGWRVINWGDRMLEIAKEKDLVKHRDEMRKLPTDVMADLQRKTAENLAMEKGKWILDTHCSINTPDGYYPGLPFYLLEKFKVDRFILIEAPVEHIIRRRRDDESRRRDAQSRRSLEEHIFINRAFLCAYSAFTGAPAAIIVNEDGKLDEAVKKLKELLKGNEVMP